MKQNLYTFEEVEGAIAEGRHLLLAGDETVLRRLPKGNWIGGTISYFMAPEGGLRDDARIFVHEVGEDLGECVYKVYDEANLNDILTDAPEHGVTYCIFPAFSEVLQRYALVAPDIPLMFHRPILGWVAGVSVDQIGIQKPMTFFGPELTVHWNSAVVVHCPLPIDQDARIDIVNIFEPGNDASFTFDECSFTVTNCYVDGRSTNLADYIEEHHLDSKLPLVTDLCGAVINSAIANIDKEKREVTFFGPVFPNHVYKFASPIDDYAAKFADVIPKNIDPVFSCNCILNYTYGNLQGKVLTNSCGPMTFGEIAYLLLSQTMVYVEYS